MNRIVKGTVNWYRGVVRPFELIKVNFGSLVAFSVFFRLLAFFVLFPILTWAERLWLVTNNTKVIAWYNIVSFIKNPFTWIVLFFMVAILVAATMFEQFALYDALHASRFGIKRTARQIFSAGFDMCAERMKARNWGIIPYVLFILRFGTLTGDVSSVISVIRIPGFILEDFKKRPWESALFACFQVIAIYIFLRWVFAIPVMMEEDETSFGAACRKSAAMTKGKAVIRIGCIVFGWALLFLFFYYAGTAVIVAEWYLLSLWLVPKETESLALFFSKRLLPTGTIFYIFFLWIVTPIVAAAFQSLYYERKEEMGEAVLPYTEAPHFIHRYPVLKGLIVAVWIISLFFSGPRRFAQIRWMLNTDYGLPMIMAHRGFSAKAPENTLPAFQMCIDEGVSAAELDVQMLGDGTIIVMHDDNLMRTTGLNKNVWEVTYDEIRDLDNGSFFSKEYTGTKIPTLDEVIKLAGSGREKLYLNIEIKRNGHDEGITQKVADIISIQETFATYENIERIHNAGKRIFVWTVNEEDTMKDLVGLNVDAILTNDPVLCKSVIDQYGSNIMNVIERIHSAFSFL